MNILVVLTISLLFAGCSTTGASVSGSVSAPITIRPPDYIHPEMAGYGQEVFAPLLAKGFKVGYTGDPDALRLEVEFNPNPLSTSVKITLIKPRVGIIASAKAVNSGWGTRMAHNSAVESRVDSATQEFSHQLANINFVITPDKNNFQSCFSDIAKNPDLEPIKGKVGLENAQSQSFSMLADNSKPTAQDKPMLKRWGDMRDVCMKMMHESMAAQRAPLPIINVTDAVNTASQSLLVELINSNMTYSEFAKKRSDLSSFANTQIAQIDAELRKQTEESRYKANQLSIQAQQNDLLQQKIFSDSILQQQQINNQQINNQQMNNLRTRPTTTNTNCYMVGNQMNCDSTTK